MDFKERYRRTFGQVHTAASVNLEDYNIMKRTGTIRKLVIIAAAVALLAALGLTAYATEWFGLRRFLVEPETPERTASVLSLQGYAELPETRAAVEWRVWQEGYDSEADDSDEAESMRLPRRFRSYDVWDETMAAELDGIASKYGLRLHERLEVLDYDELAQAVGGDFLGEGHARYAGYIYEDGSFHLDGDWSCSDGVLGYQLMRYVRGSLSAGGFVYIQDASSYSDWTCELDGRVFTMAIDSAGGHAVVLADLGSSFVALNLPNLEGYEDYIRPTRELLEALTASIDWDVLENVVEPDLASITGIPDITGELWDGETLPENWAGFETVLRMVYEERGDDSVPYALWDLDGDGERELIVRSYGVWEAYQSYENGARAQYLGEVPGESMTSVPTYPISDRTPFYE